MSKKTAIFKDTTTNAKITLIQNDDNSINLEVDNAKGLMRLISQQTGFQYDDEWNTQTLGSKLIDFINNPSDTITAKKTAVFKDEETNAKITLIQNEDNSINFEVDNAKGLMRLISRKISFQYDINWNTQTLGAKLIDFINNPTEQAVEGSLTTNKADSTDKFFRWSEFYPNVDAYDEAVENGTADDKELGGVSDGAWNWWLSLDNDIKALIFAAFYDDLYEDEGVSRPIYRDGEFECDWDYTDRKGFMSYLLTDYISELDSLSFRQADSLGNEMEACNISPLAYLPKLDTIDFSYTSGYFNFLEGLKELPYLKCISYYASDLGDDSNEEEVYSEILEFAKTHPEMKEINVERTGFEQFFLDENPDKLAELMQLLPNCRFRSDGKSLNDLNALLSKIADNSYNPDPGELGWEEEKELETINWVRFWLNSSDFIKYILLANERYSALPSFKDENGKFEVVGEKLDFKCLAKNNHKLLYAVLRMIGPKEIELNNIKDIDFTNKDEELSKLDEYGISLKFIVYKDGTLPSYVKEISQLNKLEIYSDEISLFPVELSVLNNLTSLIIREGLCSVPDNLSGFERLTQLNLMENSLTEFPLGLGALPQLTELNLKNNAISTIPDNLTGFNELEILDLNIQEKEGLTKLSVSEVIKLSKLPKLRKLTLPKYLEDEEENIKKHFSEDFDIRFPYW